MALISQCVEDVFGRMRRLSGIVPRKPLLQVGRDADIALTHKRFALQQIDVAHSDSPPPPRLRRASCFAIKNEANPAKRVARSRMVGPGGLEPPTRPL